LVATGPVDEGFEFFFRSSYAPVVRNLAVALGDLHAAEDVAQRAFAKALDRWPRVRQMDRPEGWVYVVAVNAHRRSVRTAARRTGDLRRTETSVDPAELLVDQLALAGALREIPARQRLAVVLRYLCQLSTAEVADAMHCAPGTVKSTLHEALSRLRIELSEKNADAAH
jgi:RNA polymerase sigma-70 factor, ECF subfamily